MVRPTVYIESSVISFLAARPSKDVVRRGKQIETHLWWEHRSAYKLLISSVVRAEASAGMPAQAAKRLALCEGIIELDVTRRAEQVATEILRRTGLPDTAETDALHIGIAAEHGAAFLLTWNLKHIAGAIHQPRILLACEAYGLRKPQICTPPQLMEFGHARPGSD